nr:hypothetical protein [uncultured Halomonas sp.]
MSLLTAIASAFGMPWQPIHSPQPIIQGRGVTKPHQRQAKRKRAQRRAKRLKHF